MVDYPLYLESGPKRRKTMVHVLDLLGCIARGATTEEAIEAAPAAIRQYRDFLRGIGERVNPRERIQTHVAQHITEGMRLGEGDSYLTFEGELEPVTEVELETLLRRFLAMRGILGRWAATQSDAQLDAATGDPNSKRPSRAVLLHVLGPSAQYLSPVMRPAPGYSAFHRRAERGEISLDEALLESGDLLAEYVRGATEEQRTAVVERTKDVRTLRKGLRRLLEHEWEHLAELVRRPGGPRIEGDGGL